MGENKLQRRDFLKLSATGIALTVVGHGVQQQGRSAPAAAGGHGSGNGSNHKWAMVIDQSKCVGCDQCVFACQAHNDTAPGQGWTRVEADETVAGEKVYLPIPCQHCQDAPCVDVCPVHANTIRDDGIVMIDYDRCIGCRYCQIACPYDARTFNWEQFTDENPSVPAWGQPEVPRRPRGVVEKCTFCYQRIDRGLAAGLTPGVDQMATPACVVACPTRARLFGDLNDPDSEVSQILRNHPTYRLREELGTDTRVYYLAADDKAEEAAS